MQKYKEINGNDYVKDSRTTINETMQSIQSMNSGTAFPTNNLFEGMKCYRTDLKKTYTLTDVENNTWVEDAHATLSDEATHAESATKLDTARSLNLGGAVTADAATFDGTANATINVKTLDATKLNGTASVSTTGNAATATKVVTTAADGASANIAEAIMASNDLARIRVSGATNAGELALETADDGSEPIVARQYTGFYETPVRTAKILDESGNTSFPGTVVAPKFTGSLNGNAATATKLQTPRMLSLTGKASGSTTFDGSANAAINVTSVNADTASKLSTARKINITGNATGAATFDGTSDVSINTTVNESKHAVNADVAKTLETTDANGVKSNGQFYWVGKEGQPVWLWGSNTKPSETYVYNPSNFHVAYADNATNAATATTVNATAPNGGTADLVFGTMANDDSARIRVGGSSDNGWLEIATSDNGNEPIYVRQYSGGFGQNDAKTVTNEAILLDGNGNTKFPHNVTAANFVGHLAGNADSATTATTAGKVDGGIAGSFIPGGTGFIDYSPTVGGSRANVTIDSWFGVSFTSQCGGSVPKGKTAVGIDCREGIVRARSFEGTLNGNASSAAHASSADSATNADTVDGIHAGSMFYNKGDWGADNWGTIGAYQVNNNPPVSNAYTWGQVISSSTNDGRFQLYASHQFGGDGRLHYRTGWDNDKLQPWNTILDSENYNSFAPTKTGGGASGTWGINISGNAASATNADTVDGYHASDIINRISAANTGGIVAASLTENGYVKFANGLILQWGFVSNTKAAKNYDITFPVSFASACFGVHNTYFKSSGEAGKSGDNWDTVAKITKYGCQLSADNQNVFWTAIGI